MPEVNDTRPEPERVFADTNLFLRYLTNDLPEQADAVESLLRQASAGSLLLVTNALVIAEIVWTLQSFYQLDAGDIKAKILAILNTPGIEIEDAGLVLQAIADYADLNVDYADAYNAAWIRQYDMQSVYSFDKRHFERFGNLDVRVPTEDVDPS